MPVKFEEVEVDKTYTDPDKNCAQPPQKVVNATNSVRNPRSFCHQVHSVITDPIFIEIIVVLLVILSAIASSELGILLGKSYDNAHGRQHTFFQRRNMYLSYKATELYEYNNRIIHILI